MIQEKIKCEICGKEFSKFGIKSHIWRSHTEEGKAFNPNDIAKLNRNFNKISWKKGLTKETSKSVKKTSETLIKRYKSGELISPNKGKKHSEETKKLLSEIKKEKVKDFDYAQKLIMNFKNSKSGWYKGFWCDSSYELAFVIYNLEHNIKFERNRKGFDYEFDNSISLYFPDFILEDGTYIEIKGRDSFDKLDKKNQQKIIQFERPLKVLYNSDMKMYLDYVKEKYGSNFISLYKDYVKPIKEESEHSKNLKLKIEKIKSLILNSNIDFTKYGWVQKVSNLTDLLPQKVNEFMKKYLLKFYESECYKRK
jgi:hypothetical protein